MFHVRLLCAFGLLGLAGCGTTTAVFEPDPNAVYTIVLRDPAPGDVLEVSETKDTAISQRKQTDKQGPRQPPRLVRSAAKYTETIQGAPVGASKPTKLRRAYQGNAGPPMPGGIRYPLAGQTVEIEKQGDRYAFRLASGGAIPFVEAMALEAEFNGPDPLPRKDMLPGRAVRRNEAWGLDGAKIARAFAEGTKLEMVPGKTKANGTLLRIYRDATGEKGVFEIKIELFPKPNVPPANFLDGTRIEIAFTHDAYVDGTSSTGEMTMLTRFNVIQKLGKSTLVTENETTVKKVTRQIKK